MLVFTSHSVRAKHIHHTTVITLTFIQAIVFEQAVFLNPCTVDDDFCLLIGSSELGRNASDTATLLDLVLYLLGNTTTSGITLETAHFDLTAEQYVHQSSVNYVRQAVVTDTIVNVVVIAVHIRRREESVVRTLVLSIADTDNSVRVFCWKLKISAQFVHIVEQTLTLDRLIHKQSLERRFIKVVPHILEIVAAESDTVGVIEITFTVCVQCRKNNELRSGITTVLILQSTDNIMDRPSGSDMDFLRTFLFSRFKVIGVGTP